MGKLFKTILAVTNYGIESHWENYNRIKFVTDSLQNLDLLKSNIIDVGGATGNNLLRKNGLLNVRTLDIDKKADIQASADNIPLEDNSTDVVTCIDMLEHVPQKIRINVINEMIRVSSNTVILIAPKSSPENFKAEELVSKYLDNNFINEHQEHGLVDFDEIIEHLNKLKDKSIISSFKSCGLDNLHSWVMLMARNTIQPSKLYQEAYFLENKFNPRRMAITISIK